MDTATKKGTHGWPQPRKKCKKVYKVGTVSRSKAQKILRGAHKSLDRAHAVGKGMAVVGGVLAGMQLMDTLRIDNPLVLELAIISRKAKQSQTLSIMDEVSALDNLYQLTGDPISAAYGWQYWRKSVQ